MNTENYLKVKELMKTSDAILIGAGAGLSTSAGVNYGKEHFKENFPELYKAYGFQDFYTSSFYDFETEEEKWSYWAKHIDYLSLSMGKTKVYQDLYHLVKEKNYFVITTNADKQFEKNGFEKEKIFEVQGTLTKIQCSKACHPTLYDVENLILKMLKEEKDCKIPENLVPYCPICKSPMEVNLRKDNTFVEDSWWHTQESRYEEFLKENHGKKLLLLELGVGYNTPSIIRFPFEEMTYQFPHTTLIRVNLNYAFVGEEIEGKSLVFEEDVSSFLKRVK